MKVISAAIVVALPSEVDLVSVLERGDRDPLLSHRLASNDKALLCTFNRKLRNLLLNLTFFHFLVHSAIDINCLRLAIV